MSLDSVTYATVQNIQDTSPTYVTAEVPDLVQLLLTHKLVSAKEFAGLYSFCQFKAGRKLKDAEDVQAIILDFDNAETERVTGPNQTGVNLRKTGNCVPNPVTPQAVVMQLRARNLRAVVTTSHNHTRSWPKFRVVVFTFDAIPVHIYKEIVTEFLAFSGLGDPTFAVGLDTSCYEANRFYYWPSCSSNNVADKYAHYTGGENYTLEDTVLLAPTPKAGYQRADGGGAAGQWTYQQIRNYYKYMVPSGHQHSEIEFKAACPIHGGTKTGNFCVDTRTGYWHCFSECAATGLRGGGIYSFHWNYRNRHLRPGEVVVTYAQSRNEVHDLIGLPTPATVAAFQAEAAAATTPVQIQQLAQACNNVAIAHQPAMIAAFIATHPTETAVLEEFVIMPNTRPPAPPPALQRPATEPVDGAAAYVGGFGGGPHETTAEERARLVRHKFNTCINTETHDLTEKGTFRIQVTGTGKNCEEHAHPISPHPIWVSRAGYEFATKTKWCKVHYRTAHGEVAEWAKYSDIVDKKYDAIPNFPVDLDNRKHMANYLCFAMAEFDKEFPLENVTTRYGWQTTKLTNGKPKDTLVLYPADSLVDGGNLTTACEPMLHSDGAREPWVDLFKGLTAEPFEDFAALYAFVGLSAAAPLVRLCSTRNPILMCAYATSSGKTTIGELAAAIWSSPADISVAAQSSPKGTEDKTLSLQDLPVFIEEFQRQSKDGTMDMQEANSVLYAMANGQRRTVSSKSLAAQGGEQRKGVCLVASEENFMNQATAGANVRVLVLPVKAVPTPEWSYRIKDMYAKNYGIIGRELESMYNTSSDIYLLELDMWCKKIAAYPATPASMGDDIRVIAIICTGLVILGRALGVVLPADAVMASLVMHNAPARTVTATNEDSATQCLVDLLTAVQNSAWNALGGSNDSCELHACPVAVRGSQLMHPGQTEMEIVIDSTVMKDVLRKHGVKHSGGLAHAWGMRGFLMRRVNARTNTPWRHHRLNTIGMNPVDFKYSEALVYCITPAGMALLK